MVISQHIDLHLEIQGLPQTALLSFTCILDKYDLGREVPGGQDDIYMEGQAMTSPYLLHFVSAGSLINQALPHSRVDTTTSR